MHDHVHVRQQRPPFERAGEIGDRDDFDRAGENIRRLAHGGAKAMALPRQVFDERSSDEARGAGNQDAHQVFLPRAKRASSQATRAIPIASEIAETMTSTRATVSRASPTSARLSMNTRPTISGTVKPPSVARW